MVNLKECAFIADQPNKMIKLNEYTFITGLPNELPEGIYYVSTGSGIHQTYWNGKHFLKLNDHNIAYNIFGWFRKISVFNKDEPTPELIVCAAIKFFNICDPDIEVVIPSARHFDLFTHEILAQFSYDEWQQKTQGFITNKGRFVDRREALTIAKENNQIRCDIGYNGFDESGVSYTLTRTDVHAVCQPPTVRKLTTIECERLQGFPDNWTKIPYRNKPLEDCPDSPRYKAIGNSMAVPVMRWIGERLENYLNRP